MDKILNYKINIVGPESCEKYVSPWSKKEIFINPRPLEQMVLLDYDITLKAIGELLRSVTEQAFDRWLHYTCDDFSKRMIKGNGRTYSDTMNNIHHSGLQPSLYNSFIRSTYGFTRPAKKGGVIVDWPSFIQFSRQSLATDDLSKALHSYILKIRKTKGIQAVFHTKNFIAASPEQMVRIDWLALVKRFETVDCFMKFMANVTIDKCFKSHFRSEMVPYTYEKGAPNDHYSGGTGNGRFLRILTALRFAALSLHEKKIIMLPVTGNLPVNASWEVLTNFSPRLATFSSEVHTKKWVTILPFAIYRICTMDSYDDAVPLRLTQDNLGTTGGALKEYIAIIQRYQRLNKLPAFPIAELDYNRKAAQLTKINTEQNNKIELANLHPSHAMAIGAFWQAFEGQHDYKRDIQNHYIHWILDTKQRKPFWELTTQDIYNPLKPKNSETFFKWVQSKGIKGGLAWTRARMFMQTVCDAWNIDPPKEAPSGSIFSNPMHPDRVGNPFKSKSDKSEFGKTYRPLIPTDHLEAMIHTLLDPDENGTPTFHWVRDEFHSKRKNEWSVLLNHETEGTEHVWHPARAVCLAVLLLLPIRGKQARWLDQGLLDQEVWDVESQKMIRNNHKLNSFKYPSGYMHMDMYKRDSGVLQLIKDGFGQGSDHLGLFINTNKTTLWNPDQDNKKHGYEIPWPDGKEMMCESQPTEIQEQGRQLRRIYDLLEYQIRWNEKYDPEPIPVTYADDGERFDENLEANLPFFTPIFRDLLDVKESVNGLGNCHPPVSKQKLARLYDDLAAETERRLSDQIKEQNDGKITASQMAAISLTKTKKQGNNMTRIACRYDMHSLRVSGITHLLEKGVPAHIVSEFIAGHMALVMTLHYAKFQPLKLRQKILDAYDRDQTIADLDDVLERLTEGEVNPFILSNSYYSTAYIPDEMLANKGIWTYKNGGICPGANCNEGGLIYEDNNTGRGVGGSYKFVPVPGGHGACGNCRFFLTSPAFIVEQMLHANNLMIELREFGKQRRQINDVKVNWQMEQFDKGIRTSLTDLKLKTFNDQIQDIEQLLEHKTLEWWNRYEMFKQSLALLEQYAEETGSGGKNQLILLGSADASELKASFDAEGCDFSLAKQIELQSQILKGHNKVTSLAKKKLNEFVDRILRQEKVDHLFIDVPEGPIRDRALVIGAELISQLYGGDQEVQAALDTNKSIDKRKLDKKRRDQLARIAEIIIPNAANQVSQGLSAFSISEHQSVLVAHAEED